MFGLLKTLITFVVLFLLIGLGLAYLPPDTQSKVTSQAAGLAVKGCRGGKLLFDAFMKKVKEEGIGEENKETDGETVAVATDEQTE